MAVQLSERVQYAWNAGFRNTATREGLSIIIAISMAECGVGSTSNCEHGFCCGGAAGIWQIQMNRHPWANLACAEDPACCATYAWRLSGGGVDFTPWCSFWSVTCGRGTPGGAGAKFLQYLPAARNAIAAMPTPIGPSPPPVVTPQPPVVTPAPAPTVPGNSDAAAWLLLAGGGALAWYAVRKRRPTSTLSGRQGSHDPTLQAPRPAKPSTGHSPAFGS